MNDTRPAVEPSIITLKDGRQLLLRRPVPEDAATMIACLNQVGGESDNLLFGRGEFPLTVEQEAAYIQNNQSNPNHIMVLGFIDGDLASVSLINCPGRKRIAHNGELSISVRQRYWGIGVGSAAMQALIGLARAHGGIRNIGLGVRASNTNAIGLYEKCGFVKVGFHRNYFNINGVYDDEILMDLNLF